MVAAAAVAGGCRVEEFGGDATDIVEDNDHRDVVGQPEAAGDVLVDLEKLSSATRSHDSGLTVVAADAVPVVSDVAGLCVEGLGEVMGNVENQHD